MIRTGTPAGQPTEQPTDTRPLADVLAEHVAEVQAARRAALLELQAHALPADAPGAWIRTAIDAELSAGR